jgi:hypothetical protein
MAHSFNRETRTLLDAAFEAEEAMRDLAEYLKRKCRQSDAEMALAIADNLRDAMDIEKERGERTKLRPEFTDMVLRLQSAMASGHIASEEYAAARERLDDWLHGAPWPDRLGVWLDACEARFP